MLILLGLLSIVGATTASARSAYCSSTGDYCTSVARLNGIRTLRLGTFSFSGRIAICVDPPRGDVSCRHPRLRSIGHGLREAKTRWHGLYPYHGHGTYRVRFYPAGTSDQLGPTLSFRG